ncbi:MAG: hypothetical protein OWT28_11005 [Firmicutes bacterium]|nr:hypothetical protein [Bacillota bacterium]
MSITTILGKYERVLYQRVCEQLWENVFFNHLNNGSYTLDQLHHFAIQFQLFDQFCHLQFPQAILQAATSLELASALTLSTPIERADPDTTYRRFLLSVTPTHDKSVPSDESASPALMAWKTKLLEFCQAASAPEVLIAVEWYSLRCKHEIMISLAQGLRHPVYQRHGVLDLQFWDEHAREPYGPVETPFFGYAQLQQVSASQWCNILMAAAYLMDSIMDLFNEWHNEMMKLWICSRLRQSE